LLASVYYVGKSSLVVGIKVISENVKTHAVKHTNMSYFTMVATDDFGRRLYVPGLLLENIEQIRRFYEARERRSLRTAFKTEEARMKETIATDIYQQLLKNERCLVQLVL
jgi:acyl-CoA hydrolase